MTAIVIFKIVYAIFIFVCGFIMGRTYTKRNG